MTNNPLIDLLQTFCCGEDRPNISKPFCQNGHTYATDGRIAIILLSFKLIDGEQEKPDMSRLFYEDVLRKCESADFELPELPDLEEDGRCKDCGRSGEVIWEYRDSNDYLYEKAMECPVCDGIYIGRKAIPVFFDCRIFENRCLHKIKELPGLKILPEWDNVGDYLHFKWRLGYGLLCPMRCSSSREINGKPLLQGVRV